MTVLDSFKTFQSIVNADDEQIREARRRRKIFSDALLTRDDVLEVVPSGSLARGTQLEPIHDVDLIVVFDASAHTDWGTPGESAEAALNLTRAAIHDLLGSSNGTHDQIVRLARWRNHAVKCFLDDPDDENAFHVDVMPTLRHDGHLMAPEALSQAWIDIDPEYLIRESAAKHDQWNQYAGTVRMLKWWGKAQDFKVKSLTMEVLAFNFLPTDRPNRPTALSEFFASAAFSVESGVEVSDPAGLCGPIQHDLDYELLGEALQSAAGSAAAAQRNAANSNQAAATASWAEIFGDDFPVLAAAAAGETQVAEPRPVRDSPQG